MADTIAPNEQLSGSRTERKRLHDRLAEIRSQADLSREHPGLTFLFLPDALTRLHGSGEIFHIGQGIIARRYAAYGLRRLLPLHRVWVGIHSERRPAFGGFHYPNQGYRHLQMASVITAYGDLSGRVKLPRQLVALDLVRAYAHDCLHFGTFRRYRLHGEPETVIRVRYGINFRRPDGRTYSAPDRPGAPSTRNLGVIMEGATDREARAITRAVAEQAGLTEPTRIGTDLFAFRDVTGTLSRTDHRTLDDPRVREAVADLPGSGLFLANMAAYDNLVGIQYPAFLREVGGDEAADLHTLIVVSMLSGSLIGLSRWLNQRHGPGAFRTIFKTPAYS